MKAHKDQAGMGAGGGTAHHPETATARPGPVTARDIGRALHGEERSMRADQGHVHSEREAKFGKDGSLWA